MTIPLRRGIAHMFADVTPATIPAGAVGQFSAVLENPPAESYSLDLRFVDVEEPAQHADAGSDLTPVDPIEP